MIKSNELRVGNIVQRNGDWKLEEEGFHTIIAINSTTSLDGTFDSVRTDVTGQDFLFTAQLDAIPLTEEWLLRLGFKLAYNGSVSKRYDLIKDPRFDYSFNTIDGNDIGFRFKGNYFNIKYVHQLQNLYFCLTGEELTINQP